MPVVKEVEFAKAAPSFAEAYHFTSVPVAVKLATVALLQKVCGCAIGAGVAAKFMVAVTAVLTQPVMLVSIA